MHSQYSRQTTDSVPLNQLLVTLSPQAIFCSFSPQLAKMTGWTDADWLGKPLQAFVHPYDVPQIKDRYKDVLSGRTVRFKNIRCLTKEGDYDSWALSFVPQVEKLGVSEVLVLGHLLDLEVTQPVPEASSPLNALRLHSENAPRPSSTIVEYAGLAKLLEGMLGNAPIGFALLDEEMRFICVNQAFSEMTGFSPAQQLAQPLRELLPVLAQSIEPVMQNILSSGESVTELEVEMQRLFSVEGSGYAQMSFYPIPDLHGGICGVAVIAVDITARKQSEAMLKKTSDDLVESNQALEEFSYVASHDLREPLCTITSFMQLLKERCEGQLDEEADSFINFTIGGANRMLHLIDKILEYSKAGKVEQEFCDIDCNEIVQTVSENLKNALEESGGELTYDVLPTLRGDQMLLLRTFQNLIANAIKYRGNRAPKIHVSARRELCTWVLSVADNGIGIHPDQVLNVFAPFKRLHGRTEYSGSGLGLAICEKNVERQGGKIWVTSEEGVGSTFSFTIPTTRLGETSSHDFTR